MRGSLWTAGRLEGKTKAIVCFSGGHSSALAAIETVRRFGKENVILLNHNISSHVEHEDIKRFKQDISDYLGVPVTYANADNYEEMTPLEVCKSKAAFSSGNQHTFCTYELKTKPFYEYLEKNFPKSTDTHIVYGFDANEENRINRRTDIIRAMGYTPEFPLTESKRTIYATEEIGIARPSTYKTYKHANCIGCLKAGRQHWYCVFCLRPDIFGEAKQAEDQIGYSIIKGVYLKDLEPKFKEMRDKKHILPTDKTDSAGFWKEVNTVLPEQETLFPCDCSF